MTNAPVAAATIIGQPGCGDRREGRRPEVVAALAVTTTIGYGVLYYAFSALVGPMSSDLGISTATATGALTTAVLVCGAMSIPVGRWLDARGGHGLMTLGSILGAAAVLGWSQVHHTAQLYSVFVLVGVASAMVLYEPAFAVIIAVTGPTSRTNALLVVTLVAGFASSIFIPLTGHLVDVYGWRSAVLVLGVAMAASTVPLHAIALRRTGPRAAVDARADNPSGSPSRVLADPGFWLLAVAFVLHSAALAVVAIHLVLYLISLGHPPASAAGLAGLLGVLSVTGRVVTTLSSRWLPMATIAAAILTLQGAAIAVLPSVGSHIAGAVVCLVLFGLGFGVASLATPTILLDRYGSSGYATIAGTLATPVIIARATAPLGAALLANAAGYRTVMVCVAVACLLAATALALTVRRRPTYGQTDPAAICTR